jgi:membrane protein YdbS with pleckstrin-like domain
MVNMLLRWLRVPPEPTPPEGASDSVIVFRAGRNYWRWRFLTWAAAQLGVIILGGMFAGAIFKAQAKMPPLAVFLWDAAEIATLLAYLVFLPISYQLQRLNYELRWYIVTDRSLRIRSGIWSVEEITMTFANIQDLRISAGPLQGWLGLADLVVSSAGGGAAKGKGTDAKSGHTAQFAGIENATATRDLIVARLKHYRDAGLGDRTEKPVIGVEAAATELLAAAKELRLAVDLRIES